MIALADRLAAGKPYKPKLTAIRAVLQRMEPDFDGIARSECVFGPAVPDKLTNRAHFERPFELVTRFVGDRQMEPAMWVAPFEFCHGTR